jgi:rhamnose utilization protein RhaD (predicted bifunctional aldolase and dehydrogenase)/NAD(P)-dependent dehydrogenase (short-subunit alcohol dehydrogenase family)
MSNKMENRWIESEAEQYKASDLDMRVYTSRLLGSEADLVLHGGGNTSVKAKQKNIFGEEEDILFVKGSGWDLRTIEAPGFSSTKLDTLLKLADLPTMTDLEMTRELKASLTEPGGPSPSVEAILHALIPLKFVDHTHTDAVVTISNTSNGEKLLREIYGDSVLILPYKMPGFVLARQVCEATKNTDWDSLEGIILLHHGLFTFSDSGKTAYDNMIALVNKAEDYLKLAGAFEKLAEGSYTPTKEDYIKLSEARKRVSAMYGFPMLANWKQDEFSTGYSCLNDIGSIATRGPLTPDHSLQTKRIAAVFEDDPEEGVSDFFDDYQAYFDRNNDGTLTCLDTAPRIAVWKNKGCVVFSPNPKNGMVVSDIFDHTMKAVQWGEALGGWEALSEKEIFDLEYWELEQAKLKLTPSRKEFDGKIVMVSGAASGIGKACAETFMAVGAAVVALDIDEKIEQLFDGNNCMGVVCDITSEDSIRSAVESCVGRFGGVDVLVCNAGVFPSSLKLEDMPVSALQSSLAVNFVGHVSMMRECLPYLKRGFQPTVVIVGSKNVPAPGPGAGMYSAAKAALTQMARVAAMEFGDDGIRVNTVHPNAVFDTGIWSDDVLEKRSRHYNMTVEEYKTNNVLHTEITSVDVARLVITMAGESFSKTTGAQLPIDGGNDRVI